MKTLSIIIPAYREEKRIGKTLTELASFLKKNLKQYDIEVIVVNADSPDDTVGAVKKHEKLFKDYKFKLLKPGPKVGKGRDVQYGMLRAKGDYKIFMDADLATPLHHIEPLIEELESGADIAIGMRDIKKIHTGMRSLISQGGNILAKLIVNIYYADTQCGFKAFTAKAAKLCFNKQITMGWSFDIEILVIAKKYHLEVATRLIPDWRDVAGSTLHEGAIQASLRSLKELLITRKNLWLGKY